MQAIRQLKTVSKHLLLAKIFKAVFTLSAQALVAGHRYKMVLCSDTG